MATSRPSSLWKPRLIGRHPTESLVARGRSWGLLMTHQTRGAGQNANITAGSDVQPTLGASVRNRGEALSATRASLTRQRRSSSAPHRYGPGSKHVTPERVRAETAYDVQSRPRSGDGRAEPFAGVLADLWWTCPAPTTRMRWPQTLTASSKESRASRLHNQSRVPMKPEPGSRQCGHDTTCGLLRRILPPSRLTNP